MMQLLYRRIYRVLLGLYSYNSYIMRVRHLGRTVYLNEEK